jgi:hypothetical protein
LVVRKDDDKVRFRIGSARVLQREKTKQTKARQDTSHDKKAR